jgi:hypothetical protein
MKAEHVRPGVRVLLRPCGRLLDHQVHIERNFCNFLNGRHNRRANRQVRDEMAVHDINMVPIGTGRFRASEFLAETAKI